MALFLFFLTYLSLNPPPGYALAIEVKPPSRRQGYGGLPFVALAKEGQAGSIRNPNHKIGQKTGPFYSLIALLYSDRNE